MTEQEKEDLKEQVISEESSSNQESESNAEDSGKQETAAAAHESNDGQTTDTKNQKKENEKNLREEADDEESVEEESAEEEGADETQGGMSWAERRAAKKQAKQDKKEDAYKEKIEQLEDRVRRQLAEFENFRTRSEREKQAMFEMGAKSIIEKMLPIADNFERGLNTVADEDKDKETPFVDGMNLVYRQLMTELDNLGVKPIEAVGKEFDPNFHNAVTQVESEEYESGIVAQELQKGYTYHGTVVRHSMVAVTI